MNIKNIEKEEEKKTSQKLRERKVKTYQELKRSLKDRHTQTHGNCIEIFRQAQLSLSIRREYMFVNTRQRWCQVKFQLSAAKKSSKR